MSNAATPEQAKFLYLEPKIKLCEKIFQNLNIFGGVAEAVVRGRDQQQPISQAINNFVLMDKHIEESHENLKKMTLLNQHMNYQYEAISKFAIQLEQLKEVSQSMRR